MQLTLLCTFIAIAAASANPSVTVKTLGTVTGSISKKSDTVAYYKAIPYAKPPKSDLRWQPPQPFGPFGALNGTQFGNRCMEYPTATAFGSGISEDCLFLNIAAPLPSTTTALPVLLFIHGGSYVSGSSNEYSGDALVAASSNTVIVVTVNYRLSIFGFLGGQQVANATSDRSTGNFGIQDQRLAMQWVQSYISSFGGNPNDITIVSCTLVGALVLDVD